MVKTIDHAPVIPILAVFFSTINHSESWVLYGIVSTCSNWTPPVASRPSKVPSPPGWGHLLPPGALVLAAHHRRRRLPPHLGGLRRAFAVPLSELLLQRLGGTVEPWNRGGERIKGLRGAIYWDGENPRKNGFDQWDKA